ncbi:hypothetical protein QJS10_CPA10g00432 [Acorus calamus]|uniref:1-deoxy-D-xylulose-5-phosphate synthase n=1 Tax=Acorus calamus TaxID=4465 RepID=A0AAV9DYT7_ACOCL|nr:hypothetical protein QJS10_CPA10g00432 [Acorus calamus]
MFLSVGSGFAAGLNVPFVVVSIRRPWSAAYFGFIDWVVDKLYYVRDAVAPRGGYCARAMPLPDVREFFYEKPSTPMLDMIETPIHLKNMTPKELKQLADEIRSEMTFIMSKTRRSFKASLPVIELAIAIHHVFHAPMDKILWDVGEQTYAHKILTGRRSWMHTLRQKDGISGFTSRSESEYDAFGAAHGCNSISAGLGMAVARDLKGKKERVVTVISNWTTMAGQAYEAMSNAGYLDSNMVVILNDSRHSLNPKSEEGHMAINALSSTLSKLQSSKSFRKLREAAKGVTKRIGKGMHELAAKVDEYAREKSGSGTSHSSKAAPGFSYNISGTYSDYFAEVLVAEAEREKDIVAVHAGLGIDVTLQPFQTKFPEKFFDVGMAEQHAVTFSAGLACGGLKPFCVIPSTFLQRAYDQIVHDVDRQCIPVRFVISGAGLVGSDGPVNCGAFDIAFMSSLPNMIVMAPSDGEELVRMVVYMTGLPLSLYPSFSYIGKGKVLAGGKDVALLSYGSMVQNCMNARALLADLGIHVTVADARFCKPLDITLVRQLCKDHEFLITVEEGSIGGFGAHVAHFISLDGLLDERTKNVL